jgi:serine/threonine protein kinase
MPVEHTFGAGDDVEGYHIVKTLGHGGYGAIYMATITETGQSVALKVEALNQRRKALQAERSIFILLRGCRYVPRCIRYSSNRRYHFLSMECLGPSLRHVAKAARKSLLSLSTTLRLGIEAIRGLRELHLRGIVHRDVKPSNFVLRPSRQRPLAIIDFGLARLFIDPATGAALPIRAHPGFAGTACYASNNVLRGREAGPRDDLLSVIYSLVELHAGSLPWKYAGKDRPLILALRKSVPPETFFRKCPPQFEIIQRLLTSYEVFQRPDYDLLISLLCQAMEENQCTWADQYDWETFSNRTMRKLTSLQWVIPEDEREPNEPAGRPELVVPNLATWDELELSEEGDVVPKGPLCGGCSVFWCGC